MMATRARLLLAADDRRHAARGDQRGHGHQLRHGRIPVRVLGGLIHTIAPWSITTLTPSVGASADRTNSQPRTGEGGR